jgi:glycosyltransferase involved in cell wall biosynthesis
VVVEAGVKDAKAARAETWQWNRKVSKRVARVATAEAGVTVATDAKPARNSNRASRLMRICFVGKYPPIEGGESTKLYYLASALAKRGHSIKIVSNCNAIPDENKVSLCADDMENLAPYGVATFSVGRAVSRNVIPDYYPASEELASLLHRVLAAEPVDVVVGWYLLPYAFAASTVAQALRVPFLVQHAGSDIKRLLGDYRLKDLLLRMLRSADGILAYPSAVTYFRSLGCKNVFTHVSGIPNHFHPIPDGKRSDRTYLFLGKLSRGKGLDLLIEAFAHLPKLRLLVVGPNENRFHYSRVVAERQISNVEFGDAIPPWRVPDLLRSVAGVIVPEWNFGVAEHRSRVPVEAILCGTPALVSAQIIGSYGSLGKWMIPISPPFGSSIHAAQASLTETYYNTLLDANSQIMSHLTPFEETVDSIERCLTDVVERNKKAAHEEIANSAEAIKA